MARSFLYDTFMLLFYTELTKSSDSTLAAIAEKSLKEVKYHFKHSAEWVIRMGDGTDVSHEKIQESLNDLWRYTGELFEMDETDDAMVSEGIGVDKKTLQEAWTSQVKDVLDQATLEMPSEEYYQTGGRKGIHTEHLGYMLAEMQYLKRQMPEATW